MRTNILKMLFFTIVLQCGSFAASAAVVNLTGSDATSISGLDVGGSLFDVTFENGSFNSIYGDPLAPSPVPTFWNDFANADLARASINTALNLAGALTIIGGGGDYRVAYAEVAGTNALVIQSSNGGGWSLDGYTDVGGGSVTNFATFTTTTVPAPATLLLLLSGLIAIVRIRH
jgi:hypothetical protein